jgi:molybdopterin synthase catalytic subunit
MIQVQTEDFSIEQETRALRETAPGQIGALCCFTGLVRDFGDRDNLLGMTLEHYPGMTEKSLQKIIDQAMTRWKLIEIRIIHRVGELNPGDQIVFVGVSSQHRADAFSACEYVMDRLKVAAPFWKKERSVEGDRWVSAKTSDRERSAVWDSQS